MDKLYIVMPAYNEKETINTVAHEWHEIVVNCGPESRLVIIDDGSKDDTYVRLQNLQEELPQLISLTKQNSGHGATVLYGYYYAIENDVDYVFQTDSDGQTLTADFEKFWNTRNKYDLQIGFRKHRQDGFSRIVVTKILQLILLLQFSIWITDANTPFRLMSTTSLKEILPNIPKDHNLANVLLTVLYHKNNKEIIYHPITFRPRQGGTNSINLKKISKIGWKAVKDFTQLKKNL